MQNVQERMKITQTTVEHAAAKCCDKTKVYKTDEAQYNIRASNSNNKTMNAIQDYEAMVFIFSGVNIKYLPPINALNSYYKRIELADRLIQTATCFEMSVSEYLHAQFEMQMPKLVYKKILPLSHTITKLAVSRLNKLIDKNKFINKVQDRIFYDGTRNESVQTIDMCISAGIDKLNKRLEIVAKFSPVTKKTAETEMELLTNAGVISPAYVISWIHRHLIENKTLQTVADDYMKRPETAGAEKLYWIHRKLIQEKGGRFGKYL
jgi:hypothetical protein